MPADQTVQQRPRVDTYEDYVAWRDEYDCVHVTMADAARRFPATPFKKLCEWWTRDRDALATVRPEGQAVPQ